MEKKNLIKLMPNCYGVGDICEDCRDCRVIEYCNRVGFEDSTKIIRECLAYLKKGKKEVGQIVPKESKAPVDTEEEELKKENSKVIAIKENTGEPFVEPVIDTFDSSSRNRNPNQHFRWGLDMFIDGTWANLTQNQKAIYPTIAVHCNADGHTFIGYEKIKKLSGIGKNVNSLCKKAIDKALEGLVECGLLTKFENKRVNAYGKIIRRGSLLKSWVKMYGSEDVIFCFYKDLAEDTWANLTPNAKALYPVMRAFGFSESMPTEEYAEREYDICEIPYYELAEMAGISIAGYYTGIKDLIKKNLIRQSKYYAGFDVFFTDGWCGLDGR